VLSIVIIPAGYWVGVKTHLVKNYQQERINVILDPENADKRGFGYHTWQSIVTCSGVCWVRAIPSIRRAV